MILLVCGIKQFLYTHICSSYSTEYSKGCFWRPPAFSSTSLLYYDTLRILATLASPNSILSTQGDCQIFPGSSVLRYDLKILYRKQLTTTTGLTPFVPCLPGITDLHCLMSDVFSTTVSFILSGLSVVPDGSSKSSLFIPSFIRNGSSSKFLLNSRETEPKGCAYVEIYFKELTPVRTG